MELNEAQLYNLYGSSGYNRKFEDAIKVMIRQIVIHLNVDHKIGKRKIAKRFGLKMKEVDAILLFNNEN